MTAEEAATLTVGRLEGSAVEVPEQAMPPVPLRLPRRRAGFLRAWVALFLGLTVIAAAGWWVTNSTLFDLRTLHVSGNSHVTPGDVARLGGLDDHTNVVWFSPGRVERALERDPWIKRAHVSRTLPALVSVVIEERTPVAIVMPGRWLVAADAVILGPAGAGVRLPVVAVPEVDLSSGSTLTIDGAVLAVLGSLPPALLRQVATIGSQDGPLILTLRNGVIVYYGDASAPVAKAEALEAVLAWASRNGVHPISVDVRAPGSPALVPGALQNP